MSRAKDFVVGDVLESALAVFHKQGYCATSMQDLVDAMRINRFSIYASFGSKDGLFHAALKRFTEIEGSLYQTATTQACNAKQALVEILNLTVAQLAGDTERKGCFLVNSAVEISALPQDAQQDVLGGMASTQDLLHSLVQVAQQQGDISSSHDARELAGALMAGIIGMRVLGRAGVDAGTLERTAAGLIKSLD